MAEAPDQAINRALECVRLLQGDLARMRDHQNVMVSEIQALQSAIRANHLGFAGFADRLGALEVKVNDGLKATLSGFDEANTVHEEIDRRIRDLEARPPVVNNTTVQGPGAYTLTVQEKRCADAAKTTLQRLGYTWNGGTEWKPPLGKRPDA